MLLMMTQTNSKTEKANAVHPMMEVVVIWCFPPERKVSCPTTVSILTVPSTQSRTARLFHTFYSSVHCLCLENTPNVSVEWNRNVSRRRNPSNIVVMVFTRRMRSVMNTACRVLAVQQIVNWNQVPFVHRWVPLIDRSATVESFSQSAGACCHSSCQYHRANHQCQPENDCKIAIECSGTSAVCPENDPRYFKPDRTICGAGKLLCMNGSCSLSICALHSLLPCQLKEPEDQLCMIACQQKNGLCVPYQNIQSNSTSSKPLYFPCKSRRAVRVCVGKGLLL